MQMESHSEYLNQWYSVSASSPKKGAFAVTFTNITARKKAEQELEKIMEDLRRSNTELEQFAYVVSHDLQEPLRMVASFTQLLQKRYQDKLDDEANEFINFAVDGATRMQGLINDLLTFSRIGTKGVSFNPTDMNVILENVLANIQQSTIEAEAEITMDPLPVIIADGLQMTQILQNLISNAIKFRGKSSISIHVSGENQPDKWVFSVRDNGIGIDPKHFEKIFVIFQRLHNRDEYEGTGIGLAVCKRIIHRHGGKIWVESELGKGSTFYFSIPKKEVVQKTV
jgi:light-regulated signal transduction histidine kinase (bacteriophytochrome)